MPLSVATIIDVAKVSQYLADNAIAMGQEPNKQLANILYIERKTIEWAYNFIPDNEFLTKNANYLYAMCGAYAIKALGIIGSGSGGVVPNPSGGNTSTYYYPINVTLDGSEISGATITKLEWRNLVQLSPTMTLNDTQFTYSVDYSYNILNGTFTFFSYNPQVSDVIGTFGFKPIT